MRSFSQHHLSLCTTFLDCITLGDMVFVRYMLLCYGEEEQNYKMAYIVHLAILGHFIMSNYN